MVATTRTEAVAAAERNAAALEAAGHVLFQHVLKVVANITDENKPIYRSLMHHGITSARAIMALTDANREALCWPNDENTLVPLCMGDINLLRSLPAFHYYESQLNNREMLWTELDYEMYDHFMISGGYDPEQPIVFYNAPVTGGATAVASSTPGSSMSEPDSYDQEPQIDTSPCFQEPSSCVLRAQETGEISWFGTSPCFQEPSSCVLRAQETGEINWEPTTQVGVNDDATPAYGESPAYSICMSSRTEHHGIDTSSDYSKDSTDDILRRSYSRSHYRDIDDNTGDPIPGPPPMPPEVTFVCDIDNALERDLGLEPPPMPYCDIGTDPMPPKTDLTSDSGEEEDGTSVAYDPEPPAMPPEVSFDRDIDANSGGGGDISSVDFGPDPPSMPPEDNSGGGGGDITSVDFGPDPPPMPPDVSPSSDIDMDSLPSEQPDSDTDYAGESEELGEQFDLDW